jgi:hypothetical protein
MSKLSEVAIGLAVMLAAAAPACHAADRYVPATMDRFDDSPPAAAASAASAAAEPVNFRPVAVAVTVATRKHASPRAGSVGSIAIALRPGRTGFVGVRGRAGGYLYCYSVDDKEHVSQLSAASDQPLVHVAAGEVSVFEARHPASMRSVACFSSARLLGRHPLDVDGIQDGVEGLRTRFASVSGYKFEMGTFQAKYQ